MAAALVACLGVFTAPARAAATNPNSCQYSYDDYWRDMDITLGGTPSAPSARAGDAIALNGLTAQAALPEWLAQYGYNFGLLQAGENEIPVTVWIAVRGTNTTQGVQVYEVETTAHTIITTSGGEFEWATPISYDIPAMSPTQWTARGGPVVFSQAASGSLPQLPVGPGGRLQKPRGSLYIQATLGVAQLGLDCVPGTYLAQGSERQERTATPFAQVAVPAFSCLAPVPAATNLAPVDVDLARRLGLAPATTGTAYSFSPSVSYRLPNAYLSALYEAGLLVDGDNRVTGTLTAAVDAATAGTPRAIVSGPAVPAVIRVSDGGGTITVVGESGEVSDLAGTASLEPGSWTPTGTGALGFAAGPPGALGTLNVEGLALGVRPYGSVYLRLNLGGARRLSLDCVSGSVSVAAGPVPAYSELGDQDGGDRGRYTIAANQLDPFATAQLVPGASATPVPTSTATATPEATATPVATVAPAPTAVPTPAATVVGTPVAGRATVASSKLKVAAKRVAVSVRCAGETVCRGTVRLRTATKVSVGKGAKRVVTLTSSVKYSVAAGKSANVKLSLSTDGRSVLKGRKALKVSVEVRPTGGALATRKLTLTD